MDDRLRAALFPPHAARAAPRRIVLRAVVAKAAGRAGQSHSGAAQPRVGLCMPPCATATGGLRASRRPNAGRQGRMRWASGVSTRTPPRHHHHACHHRRDVHACMHKHTRTARRQPAAPRTTHPQERVLPRGGQIHPALAAVRLGHHRAVPRERGQQEAAAAGADSAAGAARGECART